MKKYILLLLILVTPSLYSAGLRYEIPCRYDLIMKSRAILYSQVGTTEATNRNDGLMIAEYQKSVGIRVATKKVKGDPYCAGGIYWTFLMASKELGLSKSSIPIPRSGSSQASLTYAIKNGYKTHFKPCEDDLIVWKSTKEPGGHIGRVIEVGEKGWVKTIEFNTSSGTVGSQRDGGGVYIRKRNILYPLSSMYLRGLVGFKPVKS